ESGEVNVTLIFAKESRAPIAETHVATANGTAVLCGTLTKEKIAERADIEQPIDRKWCCHIHLVPLCICAETESVIAFGERDRVLPDEAIRHLPLKWSAGIAHSKQAVDGDSGCRNFRARRAR